MSYGLSIDEYQLLDKICSAPDGVRRRVGDPVAYVLAEHKAIECEWRSGDIESWCATNWGRETLRRAQEPPRQSRTST